MSIRFYRFKSLLFGFIIGCVVGGSLVWWQKTYLIDKLLERGLHFFSFLSEKDDNQLYNDIDRNTDKNLKTKYLNNNLRKENNNSLYAETSADITYNIKTDSSGTDSLENKSNIINDYSIVKEELLFSKLVKIINKDNIKDYKSKADTIFIRDNVGDNSTSSEYSVEFWKSPINFKGYKTGKNKIVLYGIYDFKKLSLKKQNDILYLQCNDRYYIIENTDDFKPLSLLSNKRTINQLGEK